MNRIRKQAKGWEKTFAKDISDKGLLSIVYKELLKLSNKKMNKLKTDKSSNKHLTKEYIHMAKKCIKRCSTSCIFRKMQIKQDTVSH